MDGVIDSLADLDFAEDAIEGDGVALLFGMRNFQGDGCARGQIFGTENCGHAAAGDDFFNEVVIESIAWIQGSHADGSFPCQQNEREKRILKL